MKIIETCFLIVIITIFIIFISIKIYNAIEKLTNKYKQQKILKSLTYNKLFKHKKENRYVTFSNIKKIGKITYIEVEVLNQLPFLQKKVVYELSSFIEQFKEVKKNGKTQNYN